MLEKVDDHTFVASHSDGLSNALYLGDMVQFCLSNYSCKGILSGHRNNPDRSMINGDQVSIVGSVMANGDIGSPSITVFTTHDGQCPGGEDEVQYLHVVETGTVTGYYRIKFMGSEWNSFLPIHADAIYIKHVLEQLSTTSEVDVTQNYAVDQAVIGTDNDLVNHYEIHFKSNTGNLNALVVDWLIFYHQITTPIF